MLDLPPSIEILVVTDTIRAQNSNISTTLDPQLFVNKLNELSARSKFSADVGSKNTNPQDCENLESPTIFKSTKPFEDMEDCELFEDVTAGFVSASNAEKPYRVTPELLAKVWRIYNSTAKRTIKVTTQLPRQDAKTSLSRNFGKNDKMLR